MKVRTMRGKMIDWTKYAAQHEEQVAIGNGMMNARGDLIGQGGKVVKKRDEIAAEYHRSNPKAVKKVSIKDLDSEVFKTPTQAVEDALALRKKQEAELAEKKAKEESKVQEETVEEETADDTEEEKPTTRKRASNNRGRKISESDT